MRIHQLEAEKKAMESDLDTSNRKFQELTTVVESKTFELGLVRSQLETNAENTVRLEERVKELEEKVESMIKEKKLLDGIQFRLGRAEGLQLRESLVLEKGYRAAHAAFPHSPCMQALVEQYRIKIFHQTWHSMLFIQKATPSAQYYV